MTIIAELSAVDRLDMHLRRKGVKPYRIQRVRNSLWTHGELASAVEDNDLHPALEGDATEAYIDALPEVNLCDPSWDSAIDSLPTRGPQPDPRPADWWQATTTLTPDDVLPDPDALPEPAECGGAWQYPGVPEHTISGWEQTQVELSLPPIAGGAPDAPSMPGLYPEPYVPTAADLADYEAWLDSIDDGPLPAIEPLRTPAEWDEIDAIRRCQISPDELGMIGNGMAL